ncbi:MULTISPECIES: hypothetical protein [Haloarcula]|jgi:hypothetical protein|uniref:Uncharacterized protein n=1 Tax=Haloarcula hispanica TaxID=51589 RepID=A0A5J5LLB9_HALHI|nr:MULTISPECIES: hypothetical protein [Haloarcula]KAA9406704.1 hypothetical protein Har1131_07790 [Haloarcula sp. CBA1131]KAA9410252.1 hypothetical protein EGO51_10705 [Haloarcula hispanica]MDQ2072710.1 hypothetical protein [Haloarcula sp. H-GB4]NHN65136.1 hypothetical protein [Haloarcula sp. JP-Z28]NHX41333.1 hypothetical protein [Haloarcula sp. R1-2]
MSYQNRASDMVSDYMNIRSLPAMLSVAFVAASLYQFGGITTVELPWLSYTLTTQHSLLISLGAFAAAFASSETKQFEYYEDWEKIAIALGPAVILGNEYLPAVNDFLTSLGDPLGMQLAFLATVVSWGVAVQ